MPGEGRSSSSGPWAHWVNAHRRRNGIDYGEHAIIELDDYVVRYFDRWLKGKSNGLDDEKPVYVFVMGANEWWAEDDWPLPGTEEVRFYLHSGGGANSLRGDGGLSTDPPGTEPPTGTGTTLPTRCGRFGTCTIAPSTTDSFRSETTCSAIRAIHSKNLWMWSVGSRAASTPLRPRVIRTGMFDSSTCTRTARRASSVTECSGTFPKLVRGA